MACPEQHKATAPKPKEGFILVKLTQFNNKPPPNQKTPDGSGMLKNMLDKMLPLWPADRMEQHFDEN